MADHSAAIDAITTAIKAQAERFKTCEKSAAYHHGQYVKEKLDAEACEARIAALEETLLHLADGASVQTEHPER